MSNPAPQLRRPPSPASRWLAGFCALSVWLLGMLASSSELHGALHADAGHADHTCAITLFSEGVENPTDCAVIAVAPVVFPAGDVCAPPAAPLTEPDDRLPPGCGPPLC